MFNICFNLHSKSFIFSVAFLFVERSSMGTAIRATESRNEGKFPVNIEHTHYSCLMMRRRPQLATTNDQYSTTFTASGRHLFDYAKKKSIYK